MNNQSNFIFFKLPYELREQIYKIYLDEEMKSGIDWTMSPIFNDHLYSCRFPASRLPGLASACKKIYHEFATMVVGAFYIWVRRNAGWCSCVGIAGFNKKQGILSSDATGPMRLSSMHKCTIRVDQFRFAQDWRLFLGLVLSDEQGRASLWEVAPQLFDYIVNRLARDEQGSATQLKETVIDWSSLQPVKRKSDETKAAISETNQRMFLDHVGGVKTLEVIRLRSNYPAWFAEYLREHYPTVRVILE